MTGAAIGAVPASSSWTFAVLPTHRTKLACRAQSGFTCAFRPPDESLLISRTRNQGWSALPSAFAGPLIGQDAQGNFWSVYFLVNRKTDIDSQQVQRHLAEKSAPQRVRCSEGNPSRRAVVNLIRCGLAHWPLIGECCPRDHCMP